MSAAATLGWGQELQPYVPGRLSSPTLTLEEALRLTLAHEPNLLVAGEDVKARAGRALEAAGAFDLTLLGTLSYEFTQRPLTATQQLEQQKKRNELRKEIAAAEAKAAQYDQLLQQLLQARSDLQGGRIPVGVNFLDPQTQAQWEALLALYRNASPSEQARIRQDIINWIDSRVGELTIAKNEQLATAIGDRQELRQLGPIADVEQTQRGSFDLQLSKYYRTGLTLTPFFSLSGESYRWQGKPKSDTFGGPGQEDVYNASLGFSVAIPLGRGKGVEAAAAGEQASRIDWEASRKTLGFAASQSVLSTIFAYLDLLRAQETVAVYQRSSELQDQLAVLTQALVDADELPRVEMARMEARRAEVRSQLAAARAGVAQAQAALATGMGVEITEQAGLPVASDALPPVPEEQEVKDLPAAALAELAIQKRLDLAAARSLERSGLVLWRAALVNLAAKKDVDVKLSYAGLSDAGGSMGHNLGEALFGNWAGPSASVGFNWEKPWDNSVQRGQLAQRAAAWAQKQITAADLERRIRLDVLQTALTLAELLPQWQAAQLSAAAARQAVENEMEKFRYGRSTLIDTIVTEQRAVEAELAVISTHVSLAQTLSKLRFDAGLLVEEEGEGQFRVATPLWSVPRVER
ncbi:MAG: TolC family protein [Thermoanaerobaculaceae bacterium]|nr:TolC family protein [Thermoanaerobaculaceae bacterium]